jgi:hypothetical protein
MSIGAMKQALEALEYADACLKKQLTTKTKHEYAQDLLMDAGVALRTAIAEAESVEPKHIVQSNGRYSPLLTHMMNKKDAPPSHSITGEKK